MISSETIKKVMGAPFCDIDKRSFSRIENVAIFLENAYLTYSVYMGKSYYSGTVDYKDITIQ